ncbi:MAG: MFS transporter [bacterium]|nr:MFS transporter [bacterium]
MTIAKKLLSPLTIVYVVFFFFSLHIALPTYINSTFLQTFVSEKYIGLIFTASSLLAIVALIIVPKLLRLVGDYFATALFLVLEIAAFIGIAALKNPAAIIALFLISQALITLISFDLDLVVERYSKHSQTGSIRGLYLTSANVAWVGAPALAGFLLAGGAYWRVYVVSSLVLIPTLLLFTGALNRFKDPLYRTIHFKHAAGLVWRSKNLRSIFLSSALLSVFFMIMVIYTPLYLHEHLGFAWGRLGIMFSFMLLPFLLLEAPLGRIADKMLGEKELLTAGFIIMALTTTAITFVGNASFVVFGLLLFGTRVGATCVEIMTETYFFKKVGSEDAQIISLQRTLRPLMGILGPLVATALLYFIPLRMLFLALGILMLFGVPLALGIKDTR